MEELPTVIECNEWITEHCRTLLVSIDKEDVDIRNNIQTTLDSTKIMVKALKVTKTDKFKLADQLMIGDVLNDNTEEQKKLLLIIQDICKQVSLLYQKQDYLSVSSDNYIREKERILPPHYKIDHDSIWPDQIEEKACWFRNRFIGNPYITLIGPMTEDRSDHSIITIVRESDKQATKNAKPSDSISFAGYQYRIIIRTKQDINMSFIVHESDAKEMMLQLESAQQLHRLDCDVEQRRNHPLKTFSSALITGQQLQSMTYRPKKIMRAALLFLFQDLNFRYFKELSAEASILAGLEKEFLRYDEIGFSKNHKFGLLTVCEGQNTEEEWFSNTGISSGLKKLLDIIGEPVELRDYKGFSGGLDTKTGESGEISYRSSWKDREIMYHVAPLMPSREGDVQQIHRKRYIGNDIVCIVFIEGKSQKFDPKQIKSQFLHVFILIQLETEENTDVWRVEVIRHTNVDDFSPLIPSPPLFYKAEDLRDFLILKLINAENTSLKSEKFSLPTTKARLCILRNLIEMGLETTQVMRSFDCNNNNNCREDKKLSETGNYKMERPKSAGAQQNMSSTIRHSFKSNNNLHIEASISTTSEVPPIPFISRSSVLRDLKNITRRKSSNQISIPNIHNSHDISHLSSNKKADNISHLNNRPNNHTSINHNNNYNNNNNNNKHMRSYLPIKHYNEISLPIQRQQLKLHDIREQKYNHLRINEVTVERKKGVISTINDSNIAGVGIRLKAQSLMSHMIGRRNSRTGLPHHNSPQ